jgi:hypothetical protein
MEVKALAVRVGGVVDANVTDDREAQEEKAFAPIDFRDTGSESVVSEVQP